MSGIARGGREFQMRGSFGHAHEVFEVFIPLPLLLIERRHFVLAAFSRPVPRCGRRGGPWGADSGFLPEWGVRRAFPERRQRRQIPIGNPHLSWRRPSSSILGSFSGLARSCEAKSFKAGNRGEAIVNVRYRFDSSVETCTDTPACFNCTLDRVHRPQMRKAA